MVEVKEELKELEYKCCTGTRTDKRILFFIANYSISVFILCFSSYKLLHNETCESNQLYSSILTMILTSWLKKHL